MIVKLKKYNKPEEELLVEMNNFMKRYGINTMNYDRIQKVKRTEGKKAIKI